jgi:hypothetical protein
MLSHSTSQRRRINCTGRTAQCVGIDNRPTIAANRFDAERRCRSDGGDNGQVRPPVRRSAAHAALLSAFKRKRLPPAANVTPLLAARSRDSRT